MATRYSPLSSKVEEDTTKLHKYLALTKCKIKDNLSLRGGLSAEHTATFNQCNSTHLLTERPQVDLDGERVAARFLVPLTLLKVKLNLSREMVRKGGSLRSLADWEGI